MMSTEHDEARLRRYILGKSTKEECEALERDYFERADVLDQINAAEEDLIDDYLSGRLPHEEHEEFESHYLAAPNHRRRVAVVRGIRNASKAARPHPTTRAGSAALGQRPTFIPHWWAVAASLLLLVGAGTWLLWPHEREKAVAVQNPPLSAPTTTPQVPPTGEPVPRRSLDPSRVSSPSSPRSQPVVIAVTISPVLVRSAAEQAAVTIGKGADILRLQLRGQADERLQRGRSVIRTVDGREVWRGPVIPIAGSPQGELARVDVPTSALRPDDYIVELFATDARGREVERHRYFLRVQAP